jgi:hypothetical protein
MCFRSAVANVVGDHQSVEIFAMMLIRITGSQLDAKSPEGPISGDRERNLCDFFDSRLVRAVLRVAVVRERGSLRVVATIEWGTIQFAIRCSVSVFVTHCRAQRAGASRSEKCPPSELVAVSFASNFCGTRATATTAVPVSTLAAAGRLPPSHRCPPGTR